MRASGHKAHFFPALALALALGLSACTPSQPAPSVPAPSAMDAPDEPSDPLEPVNRGIFGFNRLVDGVLLKPLAHIYLGVVPDPARTSLHNAITNLNAPVVFLDSLLQGDWHNAGQTAGRFAINSTLGIAGLFDVASRLGIEREHAKDFGQTLGVYGLGTGPYLVVPILGPSDVRDLTGFAVDSFADPFDYLLTTNELIALDVLRTLVKRTDLLPVTDSIEHDSFDPYATYRSIYMQHRAKVVRDYKGEDSRLEKEAR